MMKIDDFITEVNNVDNIDDFETLVREHLKTQYVPISVKISDCKNMIAKAYFKKNKETGVTEYRPDNVLLDFLFKINFVRRYLDVDIDDENAVEAYDRLTEIDAIRMFLATMFDEYGRYEDILNLAIKDVRETETNIAIMFRNQLPLFANVLTNTMEKYNDEEKPKTTA